MNSLWGFGGIVFYVYNNGWAPVASDFIGSDIAHSVANGIIDYKRESIRKTNVDRELKELLLGFRPEINIELLNVKSGDANAIKVLFTVLNYYLTSRRFAIKINVTPSGSGGVMIEDVLLSSNIKMEALHKLEIGQRLKMKWIGKYLTQSIPTVMSDSASHNLLFNTDNAMFNTDNAVVRVN